MSLKEWEKCEWCGTSYPSYDKTEVYYKCLVFNKRHIICGSCKKHLKLLRNKEYGEALLKNSKDKNG